MKTLALFVLLSVAPLCSAADSLYIIVLQPIKAGNAPFDVAKFGGALEHRNGLRLAVRLPESAVDGARSDPRVRYVQKVVVGPVERPDRPTHDDRRITSQANVAAESVGTIVRGPYAYDGTGNIWSIGSTPTPDERFTYDRIGRLSTAKIYSQAILHQQSFAYDAPGNLTNVTTDGVAVALPVQGNTNRLATSAGFTYDATGNMIASPMSTSYSYDQTGMLRSDASTPYTNVYTASDERLAVIKTSASPSWRWTLRDLSNQRVRDFESFGPTGIEYFLWLEDSYHDGSRVIASQREISEGGWRHFHLDHLGTPRLTTNEDGRQISRHDYLPYGIEVTSLRQERNRGFAREQVSRFTGHERDYLELSGADDHSVYLDYMHARMYNPNWGRFLSVDPLLNLNKALKMPQMWNRYTYVMSNPMRYNDPTGRVAELPKNCADKRKTCQELKDLRNSVPPEARVYVQATKTKSGQVILNANLLNAGRRSTTSDNFLALRQVANSPATVQYSSTSGSVSLRVGGQTERLVFERLTPQDGFYGIAMNPSQSAEGRNQVFVNPLMNDIDRAGTTGHELYGHMRRYLLGLPWEHEPVWDDVKQTFVDKSAAAQAIRQAQAEAEANARKP